MRNILEKLISKAPLSIKERDQIFGEMFEGRLTDIQVASFLIGLRAKGEDFLDLAAGARAMRAKANPVDIPAMLRPMADNCGTGGDGSGSFNISTTAAIVAASLGVRIAKHGNRSISSKCGSADLLFRAGFPETISVAGTANLMQQTNFTFFFAPSFHPAMKFVGPVRKALGIRTIFNLLGPLANPISPEVQLIGVGAPEYLEPMAQAAMQLGIGASLIVHSHDGMDEISPNAVTDCILAKNGTLTKFSVDPQAFAIKGTHDLSGGDADKNYQILCDLLSGQAGSYTEAVALNAGALLWLTDVCGDLAQGYQLAKQQILAGKVQGFFDQWIKTAQGIAGGTK